MKSTEELGGEGSKGDKEGNVQEMTEKAEKQKFSNAQENRKAKFKEERGK